jgi:Protein of unknown function (DUF3592)
MITTPTLTALATVVIGGFNLVYAGRLAWRSWRARRWPTVEGQLLSADLEQRRFVPAQAAWALRVQYRYTAGAHTYTGVKISPGGGPAFSEELGRHTIARYWRWGTAVKVHVNPKNPEDAMLAPRVSFATLLMLVVGAAMAAAGMWELLSL